MAHCYPTPSRSVRAPSPHHVNPAFLHSNLTERVIAAFYAEYDELGFGFLESNYKAGLEYLLISEGLEVEREVPIDVRFRAWSIGRYRMDMVVEDRVVVEVKSTELLAPTSERQLLNYLRATSYEVGLLLHFGPKPAFRRLVLTNDRKRQTTPTSQH